MRTKVVQTHLPPDLHRALKVRAAELDSTLSGLVREMILQRLDPRYVEHVARHQAAPAQR